MLPVLLDRQDAGHVGEGNVTVIFQQIPQVIQVFFLAFFIVRTFPEDRIPFIYNDNRLLSGCRINVVNSLDEIIIIRKIDVRIGPFQVSDYQLLHIA